MAVCELLCWGQEMVMAYWCLTLFFAFFVVDFASRTLGRGILFRGRGNLRVCLGLF